MNIENGTFDNILKNINSEKNIEAQLEFLTKTYNVILYKDIKDQEFLKSFSSVVGNLKLDSNNSGTIKESFIESLNNYYNSFMKNYEYIYENYLVNYMFKNLFPISNMSLLDTYINLIVNFSIIKNELNRIMWSL